MSDHLPNACCRVSQYTACQILILSPMPILLLIWVKADWVLWFHSGFAVPSILMAGIAVPFWAKQKYGFSCHRVRVIVWCVTLSYFCVHHLDMYSISKKSKAWALPNRCYFRVKRKAAPCVEMQPFRVVYLRKADEFRRSGIHVIGYTSGMLQYLLEVKVFKAANI